MSPQHSVHSCKQHGNSSKTQPCTRGCCSVKMHETMRTFKRFRNKNIESYTKHTRCPKKSIQWSTNSKNELRTARNDSKWIRHRDESAKILILNAHLSAEMSVQQKKCTRNLLYMPYNLHKWRFHSKHLESQAFKAGVQHLSQHSQMSVHHQPFLIESRFHHHRITAALHNLTYKGVKNIQPMSYGLPTRYPS